MLGCSVGTPTDGLSLTPLRKELQSSASRIPRCDWDRIVTGSGKLEGSADLNVPFTQKLAFNSSTTNVFQSLADQVCGSEKNLRIASL